MPDLITRLRRSLGLLVICSLLGFGLAGCSSEQTKALKIRDLALETTTEAYRKLIRWNYFEEASRYLKGKDEPLRKPALARYDAWKVTSYDIGEMVRNKDGTEARVLAHIGFYSKETGAVYSLRDEQVWWYDEGERHWYLGSPFPDFDAATRRY